MNNIKLFLETPLLHESIKQLIVNFPPDQLYQLNKLLFNYFWYVSEKNKTYLLTFLYIQFKHITNINSIIKNIENMHKLFKPVEINNTFLFSNDFNTINELDHAIYDLHNYELKFNQYKNFNRKRKLTDE